MIQQKQLFDLLFLDIRLFLAHNVICTLLSRIGTIFCERVE